MEGFVGRAGDEIHDLAHASALTLSNATAPSKSTARPLSVHLTVCVEDDRKVKHQNRILLSKAPIPGN